VKRTIAVVGVVTAVWIAVMMTRPETQAQSSDALKQVAVISLPNVTGRIDHLGFDAARQRLFVAALGNNTVEVVDTSRSAHLRSLAGFHEPQGIAIVPDVNAVAIANGDTGTLQLIDAQTFQTRWTVAVGGDADNVRYDAPAKRLYVAAAGGLYAFDPATGASAGRIAISGHPESFQLETTGTRIFANLPGLLGSAIVASNRKTMAATSTWPTQVCGGNYPMALDEPTSRLLIGCRRAAKLALVDTATGKAVTSTPIVGDTDDLFYDAPRRRVYVIGGDGFVDIVRRDGDTLAATSRITTRGGARTGLWVPNLNRLYVAVPARSGAAAEVRVFEAQG
jgi:DNA-binding beta-propeller fold protein YncE